MSKETKQKNLDRNGSWRLFVQFLGKANVCWWAIVLALLVRTLTTELQLKVPGAWGLVMEGDFSRELLMNLFLITTAMTTITFFSNIALGFAKHMTTRSVRIRMWGRMVNVSTPFFDENGPDRLFNALTVDAASVGLAVANFVVYTVPGIYGTIKGFQILKDYDWRLVAIALIMVPAHILFDIFYGKYSYRVTYDLRKMVGKLDGFFAERMRNIPLIKSYAKEALEEANGQKVLKEQFHYAMNGTYRTMTQTTASSLFGLCSSVISLLLGSYLIREGQISFAEWTAFGGYIGLINSYVQQFDSAWGSLKNIQADSTRMSRMLDAPQEDVSDGKDAYQYGDLSLKNVSFSYNEDKQILKNVSLDLKKGTTTAIVGLCGSGKSTILRLVERLYAPSSGSITMGGKDINRMDMAAYRKHIAYVQQDADVFSGTVRDIMTYGVDRQVSDSELNEVAKRVGADAFISSLPQGLDTQVATRGTSMSGGQRQRLVIARELLKDADLLIFDEPTSALDAKTAREIQTMIYKLFKGKTVVTVTHDLAMLGAADQVAVMEQGVLVDKGPHGDLLTRCQIYHDLVDEQSFQEVFER